MTKVTLGSLALAGFKALLLLEIINFTVLLLLEVDINIELTSFNICFLCQYI